MEQPSLTELMDKYPDQESARAWFEEKRWGTKQHPKCPECEKRSRISTATAKIGVYRCLDCLKEFTVRTGTVMERSHIPLNKWLYAIHLLNSSNAGISSVQLAKQLDITQKSAWLMLQRLKKNHTNDDNDLFLKPSEK